MWVVQSFREDSFSEANPALTSENPKLSAEDLVNGFREQAVPLAARPCGEDRRARASTHGEAGPLWVSCLSWPYPDLALVCLLALSAQLRGFPCWSSAMSR